MSYCRVWQNAFTGFSRPTTCTACLISDLAVPVRRTVH